MQAVEFHGTCWKVEVVKSKKIAVGRKLTNDLWIVVQDQLPLTELFCKVLAVDQR